MAVIRRQRTCRRTGRRVLAESSKRSVAQLRRTVCARRGAKFRRWWPKTGDWQKGPLFSLRPSWSGRSGRGTEAWAWAGEKDCDAKGLQWSTGDVLQLYTQKREQMCRGCVSVELLKVRLGWDCAEEGSKNTSKSGRWAAFLGK